jgi:hypothetical protein
MGGPQSRSGRGDEGRENVYEEEEEEEEEK